MLARVDLDGCPDAEKKINNIVKLGIAMNRADFESLLIVVSGRLTNDIRINKSYHVPSVFEDRVRVVIEDELRKRGLENTLAPIVQGFPDIVVGEFGVEVKATESDSWRCIANSVSEGSRNMHVKHIYIMYGKMGGTPETRWASYGDAIVHVRTSHVPRFEVEMGSERSLFNLIGVSYDDFRTKSMHEKMDYIRAYARGRLRPGERLWWLEDKPEEEQTHSLPINIRLYMELPQEEKRRMRAEAALMCPQIVGGSRERRKYVDAVTYLMSYRGILCPQARDLFSAGSVALRADDTRGGKYILRSLLDIQDEMRSAAYDLESGVFTEYWGVAPEKENRILHWLKLADKLADGWKPSDSLFLLEQGRSS
jgi:hypothetical protein